MRHTAFCQVKFIHNRTESITQILSKLQMRVLGKGFNNLYETIITATADRKSDE